MTWRWPTDSLRALILLTAGGVMVQGDLLYGAFCLVAVGLTMVPAIGARNTRARIPIEVELVLLALMVGDMTLGNLLGLYVRLPWFDKVLHLGSSTLIGWIGFLTIYVLHATGRLVFRPWHDGVAILLVTLGTGAAWEIAEYAVDQIFGRATQGAPGMTPLDDTMIDLVFDAIGGAVAAVLGPLYIRYSSRSRRRIDELVTMMAHPRAPTPEAIAAHSRKSPPPVSTMRSPGRNGGGPRNANMP
jgi:hypothetical protein